MTTTRVRLEDPTGQAGHWYFVHHKALRLSPQYRGLTLIQLRVLDALIVHVGADGKAWPSMRTISKYCPKTSNGAISKALRALEECGLIRIRRGDRTRSNRYHLWTIGEREGVRTADVRRVRTTNVRRGMDGGRPCISHGKSHGRNREEKSPRETRVDSSSSNVYKSLSPKSIQLIEAFREAGVRSSVAIASGLGKYGRKDMRAALDWARERKPRNLGAYLSALLTKPVPGGEISDVAAQQRGAAAAIERRDDPSPPRKPRLERVWLYDDDRDDPKFEVATTEDGFVRAYADGSRLRCDEYGGTDE